MKRERSRKIDRAVMAGAVGSAVAFYTDPNEDWNVRLIHCNTHETAVEVAEAMVRGEVTLYLDSDAPGTLAIGVASEDKPVLAFIPEDGDTFTMIENYGTAHERVTKGITFAVAPLPEGEEDDEVPPVKTPTIN